MATCVAYRCALILRSNEVHNKSVHEFILVHVKNKTKLEYPEELHHDYSNINSDGRDGEKIQTTVHSLSALMSGGSKSNGRRRQSPDVVPGLDRGSPCPAE